jgi:hypothetical protein
MLTANIVSSEIRTNIQTGNSFAVTVFNEETISYQEHLGLGKFLVVIYRSENDCLLFLNSEDGLITDNLGDQSCLDDCLEVIQENQIISGWYSPQLLDL